MSSSLRYIQKYGTKSSMTLSKGTVTVSLIGKNIVEINLEPLRKCKNLYKLDLHNNLLSSLDLSPLESLEKFEILYLWKNPLGDVDLSVLKTLHNLKELGLSSSKLEKINLTPLKGCKSLRTIGFWSNKIQTLDLRPFSACTSLTGIWFSQNPISSVDISPLIASPKLRKIGTPARAQVTTIFGREFLELVNLKVGSNARHFDQGISESDFKYLRSILQEYEKSRHPWKAFALAQEVLRLLGFSWVGMLTNSIKVVKKILVGKVSAKNWIVDALCVQIDNNESTIGLKIEGMMDSGDLVARMPRVLELRQEEIERVSVGKAIKYVNLKPLWLTAYGNSVLTAIQKFGVRCTPEELETVERMLKQIEIDIDIKRSIEIELPRKIPELMREYIFKLSVYNKKRRGHLRN